MFDGNNVRKNIEQEVQVELGLEIGLGLLVCEEEWVRVRKWENGGDETWKCSQL